MAGYNFKNNLSTVLYEDISDTQTYIKVKQVVDSTTAADRRAAFPTTNTATDVYFTFTIYVPSDKSIMEIVKCTDTGSNTMSSMLFTCVRGCEGTVARAWPKDAIVEHRLTADAIATLTDSTSTVNSLIAASATAVKQAYDKAEEAKTYVPAWMIGALVPHTATSSYIPEGCVPANGAEYTQALFPTFYDDFLVAGKLNTCTYSEYASQVATTGNCAKYAVDTVNNKFKVPLLKDGDSITNAYSSNEIGKSYLSGLPNFGGFPGMTMYGTGSNGGFYPAPDAPINYVDIGGGKNTPCQSVLLSGSKSNVIYGRSNTVTDEQIRVRWFVVLASTSSFSSIMDWSNYMVALNSKATIDLNNLTHDGTVVIANAASPSTSGRIAVSGPATSGGYTAAMPSSGWFQCYGPASTVNGNIGLQTYSQVSQSTMATAVGNTCMCSIYVSSGEKIMVSWYGMSSITYFFTPDKGTR